MRGALSWRLYRGFFAKAGISGMPVQYLKRNAKATPKYQGSNWSIMSFPVVTRNRSGPVSAPGLGLAAASAFVSVLVAVSGHAVSDGASAPCGPGCAPVASHAPRRAFSPLSRRRFLRGDDPSEDRAVEAGSRSFMTDVTDAACTCAFPKDAMAAEGVHRDFALSPPCCLFRGISKLKLLLEVGAIVRETYARSCSAALCNALMR